MKVRKVKTNFTGGEIGSLLGGRSNLQVYEDGASELRDWRLMPQGGVRHRPGTLWCYTLQNIPYQHEEYIFNSEQAYQLILSNARVDIFDGDGAFVQTLTGAPWTAAMLGDISVDYSGDVIILSHPDLKTQKLQRTGATTFVRSDFAFEQQLSGAASPVYQPYYKYATAAATMEVTQTGGYSDAKGYAPGSTVSLECSEAIFTANYVGAHLKIGTGQVRIDTVVDSQHATGTVKSADMRVLLTEQPLRSTQGSNTVEVFQPYHAWAGGETVVLSMADSFRNLATTALNGAKTITAVTADTWSFDCGTAADRAAVGGGLAVYMWAGLFTTTDWQEPLYSVERGWPHCVGFHQRRLGLGGGRSSPNRLNLSKVEAPYNFDVGTGQDDESIQVAVDTKRTPIVRHIISDKHLQIYTSEGEYYAPFGIGNKPLTPATISIMPQTRYGVLSKNKPLGFDGGGLMVTKTGKSVREVVFGNNDVGYSASNVSFQASHLLRSPGKITALLEDDEQQEAVAYLVNETDGTLSVFSFVRKEQVAGWTLWTTQGLYKSACAVDRKLFFIVQRTVNGATKTFLEKMDHDALLDCAIMDDGAAATTWTGFSHLASQSVDVVVGGTGAIGPRTVTAGGNIVLDAAATSIQAGFKYVPTILTLPPELALQDGPTLGRPRRVVSCSLQVDQSVSVAVRGVNFTVRSSLEDLSTAPELGDRLMQFWLMGWDQKGQVRITCPDPVPCTILSLSLEVEF